MKIGFDAKRALHNRRGLGNFSRTLLEGLKQFSNENEFHLYSPIAKDEEFIKWINENEQFIYHFPENPLHKKLPSLWRTFSLTKDLKLNGLDIYHGLSHELPSGIEKLDLIKIVTIHDLIYVRYPEYFPWIDRKVYALKFKHSCKVADKIIAICQQTKNDLINFFNTKESKIEVVYQACHPQFYDEVSEEKKDKIANKYNLKNPFILFVGAFEERKNALGLLNAYSSISDKIQHDLVLIGRGGTYKEKLYSLREQFGLTERVKILEDVPYHHNPAICQLADLVVYPSFFEGFGLPIVESMFSKTPVITSRGGVFPEAGGDAVEYTDPYDPIAIAESIMKVISSRDLQIEMIEKGRDKAKEFHLSKTSNKLMGLYKDLV